jgi:hypothetical protein
MLYYLYKGKEIYQMDILLKLKGLLLSVEEIGDELNDLIDELEELELEDEIDELDELDDEDEDDKEDLQ